LLPYQKPLKQFKMKKLLLCTILSIGIFSIQLSFSQNLTFQKAIGSTGMDKTYKTTQFSDGSYVLAGTTNSFGVAPNDAYIVKLDVNGNLLWTKVIGGSGDEGCSEVVEDRDGGILIIGVTTSFGAGGSDFYVIKLTTAGTLLWTKTFGTAANEDGNGMVLTADGGYAISGNTIVSGNYDYYIIKLSSTWAVQWSKRIGGSGTETAVDLAYTPDNGFIIGGFTTSFGAGGNDFYAVKLDASGSLVWTKTIGGPATDKCYGFSGTSDGGCIMSGYTLSYGAGSYDNYFVKLSSTGGVQWAEAEGGNLTETSLGIVQTTDGNYASSGITTSFGSAYVDGYVVKIKTDGTLLWTNHTGGSTDNRPNNLVACADGGILTAGSTKSYGQGDEDVYVIKTAANGNLCNSNGTGGVINVGGTEGTGGTLTDVATIAGTATSNVISGGVYLNLCTNIGVEEITNDNFFSVYPNPSNGTITVQTKTGFTNSTSLRVFNTIGSLVHEQSIQREITGLDLKLAAGVYFFRIDDGERSHTEKLIIE
jgi:hypothetical protein